MASSRTLLAVHAHPDDETITMGGTLARYGAEGVRTVVVTCTGGDLGDNLDPLSADQDLADVRQRELKAAARVLGVSRVVQLGYADSGMPGWPENHRPGAFFAADLDEASARLVDVLLEERPGVLVGYDETGGYGHPDHLKAHQVTLAAFKLWQRESAGARLFYLRFPLSWSRQFVRALREAGIDAPGSAPTGADAGPDVAEIGVAEELATTAVDVRKYVPIKLAALACYASQVPPRHFLRRMSSELAERLWACEYFSCESGAASKTDLFDILSA